MNLSQRSKELSIRIQKLVENTTSFKVHNLNGTSDYKPKSGEKWLAEWKKAKSETSTPECANSTCSNLADLGGHVQKHGHTDRTWYIVPICRSCNGKDYSPFNVRSETLVPVNQIQQAPPTVQTYLDELRKIDR